jgi:predicted transcriptional regulator
MKNKNKKVFNVLLSSDSKDGILKAIKELLEIKSDVWLSEIPELPNHFKVRKGYGEIQRRAVRRDSENSWIFGYYVIYNGKRG